MTIKKGFSYKDLPPHEKTEATKRFERELDKELRATLIDDMDMTISDHICPNGDSREKLERENDELREYAAIVRNHAAREVDE